MLDIMLITAVQIIIEALPISSSGHVLLAQLAWGRYAIQPLTQLPDFFDHFLHGPTVLIVLVVFFKDWFFSARRLFGAWCALLFGQRSMRWSERRLSAIFLKIFWFVCAADVITAVAYGAKNVMGQRAALFNDPRMLLGALCVTSLLLLSLLFVDRRAINGLLQGGAGEPAPDLIRGSGPLPINNALNINKSIILGTVQGIAFLCTGLSRFGSTYVVGRWLGLSPRRSFQFSFLMQFPLIAAAFVINGIRGMIKAPEAAAYIDVLLLVTMLGATIVAGLLFAWVYRLAVRRQLWWFGVYMFVPVIMLLMVMIG